MYLNIKNIRFGNLFYTYIYKLYFELSCVYIIHAVESTVEYTE